MQYSSVTFTSSTLADWQRDLLIDALAAIGYDTFENQENGFVAYIPTALFDTAKLAEILAEEAAGIDLLYEVQEIEHQNWNVLWESNFQPITVDGSCYVRATFHAPKPDIPYEIVIDPKMSFGTGHHQTTSMMLSYILANNFQGKTVVDMGCGTGILAILAVKRGAKHVLAVDFDEICVESVKENKILNDIEAIEPMLGTHECIRGKVFDVVLANINRNILLEQLDQYSLSLSAGGELYMSGFYKEEDLEILKDKAQSVGLIYENEQTLDKWCSAKFIKQ